MPSQGARMRGLMTVAELQVRIEQIGDVAVLTMDAGKSLNPLSDNMRADLLSAVEAAIADSAVRALVLTGAGGNFSSGSDMAQLAIPGGFDPERYRRRLMPLHRLIELIASGPKPVIAAVEGAAFGAGLSIAAACDFFIASETARFGAAFGKVGLIADCGLMWSLPCRIGFAAARDLLLTARALNAQQGHAMGLCDALTPAGGALEAAMAKANDYRNVAPLSIAAMKAAFANGPLSLAEALAFERLQQPMMSITADHADAVHAFGEKRTPTFSGR
jgi:2-(1,2-epoxy-1,2-dihydrophenyl)acetyl-CoA isomerase